MRELPAELLSDAFVVVDQRAAALEEAGEIIDAVSAGHIATGDLTELGPALETGLARPAGRTVFKSVGLACQDWAPPQGRSRRACLCDYAESQNCRADIVGSMTQVIPT